MFVLCFMFPLLVCTVSLWVGFLPRQAILNVLNQVFDLSSVCFLSYSTPSWVQEVEGMESAPVFTRHYIFFIFKNCVPLVFYFISSVLNTNIVKRLKIDVFYLFILFPSCLCNGYFCFKKWFWLYHPRVNHIKNCHSSVCKCNVVMFWWGELKIKCCTYLWIYNFLPDFSYILE